MKTCSHCKERKKWAAFNREPSSPDEHSRNCRACMREIYYIVKEKRKEENRQKKEAKLKQKKLINRWVSKNTDKRRRWLATNPCSKDIVSKTITAIRYRIRKGKIERAKNCEICKSEDRIIPFHFDYSTTFKFDWFCLSCSLILKEKWKRLIDGKDIVTATEEKCNHCKSRFLMQSEIEPSAMYCRSCSKINKDK